MKLSSVRPSVRLSVCPIIQPLHAAAAGLLLWARRWTAGAQLNTDWTIVRHNALLGKNTDCYPTASRLRFEPRPFCA